MREREPIASKNRDILRAMKNTFQTISVSEDTKIYEIISAYVESDSDLILIDETSVFSQPHLELLTD